MREVTSTKRVSFGQRKKLFAFMRQHENLARGLILGPNASNQKRMLLEKLAAQLNAMEGCHKTPDKWLKCWHDWKSDVKSKYLRIKTFQARSGGVGSSPVPLTALEEALLKFFGVGVIEVPIEEDVDGFMGDLEGLPGVGDPLKTETLELEELEESSMDVEREEVVSCAEEDTNAEQLSTTQKVQEHTKSTPRPFFRRRPKRFIRRTTIGYESAKPQTSVSHSPGDPPDTTWLLDLERRRVDAEIRRADAATLIAEAAHIQAEAARTQAETARIQAEGMRAFGDVMRMQMELLKSIIKN